MLQGRLGYVVAGLAQGQARGVEAELQVVRRGTHADLAAELGAEMGHAPGRRHRRQVP